MKKKVIKLLAIVLTVSMSVIGCTSEKKSSEEKELDIGEYNIQKSKYIHLTMLTPKTINPILNTDKSVSYIMNLIYDGLFEMDKDYNVEPRLAEKYFISSDGKSINIKLNSDAKWHNNNQVTSSDVVYTVDLIRKNSDSVYSSLIENIESISTIDSKNFTIYLKQKDPFAIDKLIFPIVSRDKLSNLKTEEVIEYNNNFIGNGPYKIKEYKDRKYILLERNEQYFGDLPENRKEIYVKIVPDKESQTEMVLSLDSDIASIGLEDLSKFEKKKEFNMTNYEGRDYEMVIFNYDNDYLNNANFRKAIISSIDRDKLIKEAYVGKATLSHFPLNTNSKYYNKDIKSLAYDKDKAIKYLGLGLTEVNKSLENQKDKEYSKENSKELSGIIEDNSTKDSSKSKFTKQQAKEILKNMELNIIAPAYNDERIKVAKAIKENLETIGIKSVIKELNEEGFSKALSSKEYDLAVLGYSLSSIPDATFILKDCNIKDEKLSTYIESLGKSSSQEETKKIYEQIQRHIVNQGSFISIGILDNFIVSNKRLEGTIYPNDFDIYKGISNLQMSK